MMINTFIDVKEGAWYYNEVMEAANYLLEDGQPLAQGITYNVFEPGKPYVYEEKLGSMGNKKFTLDVAIEPSAENPLFVYVDGVQTMYKSVEVKGGKTEVELYIAPKTGATVSFASYGVPKVDKFGKPSMSGPGKLPSKPLDHGSTYYYNIFSRDRREYCYAFGKALRRIDIQNSEWESDSYANVALKHIGFKNNCYTVDPAGTIYLSYNLNGVRCRFQYWAYDEYGQIVKRGGWFNATTDQMMFANRFFPNAYITRAEAYVMINRLRKSFYARFTDHDAPSSKYEETIKAINGQRVIRLNGYYPAGKGVVTVELNGKRVYSNVTNPFDYDFVETDDRTIVFEYGLEAGDEVFVKYHKTKSDRLVDVGVSSGMVASSGETVTWNYNSWWVEDILSMEHETYSGGYLINGVPDVATSGSYARVDGMFRPIHGGNPNEVRFMPHSPLTRAEGVAFLNRFRKWSLERFKY